MEDKMSWSKNAQANIVKLATSIQALIINAHRLHVARISASMINSTKAATHRFLPKKEIKETEFHSKQRIKLAEAKKLSESILSNVRR